MANGIELAAIMFPDEWAQAASLTGKKARNRRHALRRRAAYERDLAALPANARCGTCAHRGKVFTLPEAFCELDSDHGGYLIVLPDDRCPRWKAASQTRGAR